MNRLRNNLIAGFIVLVFLIGVASQSIAAADPIVTDNTNKVITTGTQTAVSVMCQDPDVWTAMMNAGTPCPIDGLIGNQAKAAWAVRTEEIPMPEAKDEATVKEKRDKVLSIMAGIAGAFLVF